MKTRPNCFTAVLALFVAISCGGTTAAAAAKPNIIVIMADDMGYADTGFTGAKDIQTPNLDRLAASGVIFTRGCVNHPFRAPTRAALLTGRYQHRFGFETNPAYDPANPLMGLDPDEMLFPARLETAGVSEWHGATLQHRQRHQRRARSDDAHLDKTRQLKRQLADWEQAMGVAEYSGVQ